MNRRAAIALVLAFLGGSVFGLAAGATFGASPAPLTIHLAPGQAQQITIIADATPRPTVTPRPTATPIAVRNFPATGTVAQFLALVADMTIDVIEMAAGTYQDWVYVRVNVDRSARPLTIRPAPGATVIFDGTGILGSGDGLFYVGVGGYASGITFDRAGGSFVIQHYRVVNTGLIVGEWQSNVTFRGFLIRDLVYTYSPLGRNWVVYVSSDGTHVPTNLEYSDFTVALTGKGISAFHVRAQTAPPNGVTVKGWTVSGCDAGFVGRFGATNVLVDGWAITDCNLSFDSQGPAGIVKNVHAVNAGVPIIQPPMVDGGGNTWT